MDIQWQDGGLTGATIRSIGGTACRVRYGDKVANLLMPPGQVLSLDGSLNSRIRIVLVGDSTVTDGSGWGLGFKQLLTRPRGVRQHRRQRAQFQELHR